MESKTLVILINDFGWDFLVNDLPEDRVAARPGDLSLGDFICHLCLPPEQLAGEKVGRRRVSFFNVAITKSPQCLTEGRTSPEASFREVLNRSASSLTTFPLRGGIDVLSP